MLESKVYQEDNDSKDQRGHKDKQCRTLQLLPSGPGDLLCQFLSGLFQIVNELSHLCLQWAGGKLEAGIYQPKLNIYQIVTFDILAGEAGFEPTSTVLETAELPLFYSPVKVSARSRALTFLMA